MGKMSDLLLGLGLDTKELEKGLKSVDKMFGDLEKSMSKIGLGVNTKKPIDDQIKGNKELQAKIKELEKSNKAIDKKRLRALRAQQRETAKLTKLQEQQRKEASKSFKLGPAKDKTVRGINKLEAEGADVTQIRKQLGDVKDQQGLLDFKKKLTQEHKDFIKFKDAESKDNLRTVKQELKAKKQESDTLEKIEATKQANAVARSNAKKKRRASNHQIRLKQEADYNTASQKALQDRLKSFKKTKGLETAARKEAVFLESKVDQAISARQAKQSKREVDLAKLSHSNKVKDDKLLQEMFDSEEKLHQKKVTRSNQRKQRRAANHQLKLKQAATEQQVAQKSLQERLRGFKQDKQGHLANQKMIHQAYKMNDKFDSDLAKRRKKRTDAESKRLRGLQRRAEAYIDTIENSASFRKMGDQQKSRIRSKFGNASEQFVKTGSARHFKQLNAEIREFNGRMTKLNVIQGGLADSTRNMIRSYASMFALFQGTTAIEKVGMEFQGMEAAMLASAGGPDKAAKDLKFVDGLAERLGLNLKDATDSYVKLQFATKGKIEDSQVKNLFEGLSEFGTALKVAPESMKLAQRALSQMASKNQIMAKFPWPFI